MSRAYIGYDKFFEEKLRDFLKKGSLPMSFEEFINDKDLIPDTNLLVSLNDLKHDKIFRAATHCVRFNAEQYIKFVTSLQNLASEIGINLSTDAFAGCPFMVPDAKNPAIIKVFRNLPIDMFLTDGIRKICWPLRREILQTFYITYRTALENPNTIVGWQPFSRALHRIWRTEDVALERVLTNYTKVIQVCKLNDAQIRNLAEAYIESFKPAKLIWCEKPEDYITMYATGPTSCMSRKLDWEFLIKDYKLHPTSLFHYTGKVKGVYISRGNKVVARTFVYNTDIPDQRIFGRIYSSNEQSKQRLVNALLADGVLPIGDRKTHKFIGVTGACWARKYSFIFPNPPQFDKQYILPIPYADNHTRNVHISFDADKKQFLIEVLSTKPDTTQFGTACGYITHTALGSTRQCQHCGGPIGPRVIMSVTNRVFCTHNCAREAGFIYAINIDGNNVYVPRETNPIRDVINDRYYTTMEVAKRMGAYPELNALNEVPEEGDWRVSCEWDTLIAINSEYYRFSKTFGPIENYKDVLVFDHTHKNGRVYILKKCPELNIEINNKRVVEIEHDYSPLPSGIINQFLEQEKSKEPEKIERGIPIQIR